MVSGILIFLEVTVLVFATTEWMEPFLQKVSKDINFQDGGMLQKISLDEEMRSPFLLARINYNGSKVPYVGAFLIGDNNLLGAAVIRSSTDSWAIEISKRQDYENKQQRIYVFSVDIETDTGPAIQLSINNIFDNNPSITYSPSPCKIPELMSNFITNCIVDVYDADGMHQNDIEIRISGQSVDENTFTLVEYGRETENNKYFALKILNELHYDRRAVYNIIVTAFDINCNMGNISFILMVVDVPNQDPVWVKQITTETFSEKTKQIFFVKAIDGDTEINKPIHYRLEFFEKNYSEFIRIERETGKFIIDPIDRDELNQDLFTLRICAYKFDNSSWVIKNVAVLVVTDLNDHVPEIFLDQEVSVPENTFTFLDLHQFTVIDKDFGTNATFNITIVVTGLSSNFNVFKITPNIGYQNADFQIRVSKPELLDYEDHNWNRFDTTIQVQEQSIEAFYSQAILHVVLVNWNDEVPVFNQKIYTTYVSENSTAGLKIAEILATDRDIGDIVLYTLLGNINGLQINNFSGIVYLTEDNVFDYERQNIYVCQVKATDTLKTPYSENIHTVFSQLTINIIDVNDETPLLFLPNAVVQLPENTMGNALVESGIQVIDSDTNANIQLAILWEKSYATKEGLRVNRSLFEGCVLILKEEIKPNVVNGCLIINNDFVLKREIDFEKFDTLYLRIEGTDLNQEENRKSTEDILTIQIIDLNDNPPSFVYETLSEKRKVLEEEEIHALIGSIAAMDADGPGNNKIEFSIRPVNHIEDDLVYIDTNMGVIKVKNKIQCDVPKIENLEYDIILSDLVHNVTGRIKIFIVDINNKSPEIGDFQQDIRVYENASDGAILGQVKARDLDRDRPHNILKFSLKTVFAETRNLFSVNILTGEIVLSRKNDAQLDRDGGIEYHLLSIEVSDNFDESGLNFGPSNHAVTYVNVTLLDVNDNAPQMPLKNEFKPFFFEENHKGTLSKVSLVAVDKDKENTPASDVSLSISQITPVGENAENVHNYERLFGIQMDKTNVGKIVVNFDLKGYYGFWEVKIFASDHGEPPMWNSSVYEINVRPYNFHYPLIIFPLRNQQLRLCKIQKLRQRLYNGDCFSHLRAFEASDPDGGIYGDINFILSSDYEHDKFFDLVKVSRNSSHLVLRAVIDPGIYNINIAAVDGDGKTSTEFKNLEIFFIDIHGYPIFEVKEFNTNFTENERGLNETRLVPKARNPKYDGSDNDNESNSMFYMIDYTFEKDSARFFQIDKDTRELYLLKPLDRELQDRHTIRILATTNIDAINTTANRMSYLKINVMVNDVNDNSPVFREMSYACGVTTKDQKGKQLLTFSAYDPDLNDPTTYVIKNNSMRVEGIYLQQHKINMFEIDSNTGSLHLKTPVNRLMTGYFLFDVMAYDNALPPHSTIVETKIYIISERNRVRFTFLGDFDTIISKEVVVRKAFAALYGYDICNIDSVQDTEDITPNQKENEYTSVTQVIVHFIHNNEGVEAFDIEKKSNDLQFVSKLRNIFQNHNLILRDIPHLKLEINFEGSDNLFTITLVALSAFLTVICIALITIFFVQTKKLKNKIKAFKPTVFNSKQSTLVRKVAPNTNTFLDEDNEEVGNKKTKTMLSVEVPSTNFTSDPKSLNRRFYLDDDAFVGINEDTLFSA